MKQITPALDAVRSFAQEFFEPLDDFRRLGDHLFRQRFKLLASYGFDRPSPLFCLCQKLCIFYCSIPRLAQWKRSSKDVKDIRRQVTVARRRVPIDQR